MVGRVTPCAPPTVHADKPDPDAIVRSDDPRARDERKGGDGAGDRGGFGSRMNEFAAVQARGVVRLGNAGFRGRNMETDFSIVNAERVDDPGGPLPK